MGKKIISFSLFDDNPLYSQGMIENAKLQKVFFPDWQTYVFYHQKTVDQSTLQSLSEIGVVLIPINHKYNHRELHSKGTFWRYYPLSDSNVDYIIFRDSDSRLSDKEKQAVDEWLQSGRDFHLMYDHPQHNTVILGGLWGAKGGLIPNIKDLIRSYIKKNDKTNRYLKNYDQSFLKNVIWKKYAQHNYLAHGQLEDCRYHLKLKIKIQPYPEHQSVPVNVNVNDLNPMKFLGETIYTTNSRPKIRDLKKIPIRYQENQSTEKKSTKKIKNQSHHQKKLSKKNIGIHKKK